MLSQEAGTDSLSLVEPRSAIGDQRSTRRSLEGPAVAAKNGGATVLSVKHQRSVADTPLAGILAEYAAALRERFGRSVVALRLFGSHARGEAHEDSDVDVAVVLDRVDWDTKRQVIDIATDISLKHGVRISPAIFDHETYEHWRSQERALVVDIESQGVPV